MLYSILDKHKCGTVYTWACCVCLILTVTTVICSITEPSFGNAAIVAALELINGTGVIICKEFEQQRNQLMTLQLLHAII